MTGSGDPRVITTSNTSAVLPPVPAAVHFIGIGGIGMSGLARILHAWEYRVSGSDTAESVQTIALTNEGIPVTIGHGAIDRAAHADLLVMSAAIRSDDPELLAARHAGVRVIKRAELLGMLANERKSVAIAGSHGKSTTSGMITSALLAGGAAPSYAIGAIVATTGTNAAPGSGELMVVEADEYDYSFLQLQPDIAVVTNIEYDHPDIFADQTTYDDAFRRFIEQIKPDGVLITAQDDPGSQRIMNHAHRVHPKRVLTFGETPQADWQLVSTENGWTVRAPDGSVAPLRLAVPGRHNARNAVAAIAALVEAGWSMTQAVEGLAVYRGVGRRFDFKGCADDVIVVDDYAHHPTEISATIAAARERYPDHRLWAVFQPHTYSRTKALLIEFAEALSAADQVIVLDIYPSRETDTLGISAKNVADHISKPVLAGGQPPEIARYLCDTVRPRDIVLTLGAGDVTKIGPLLLELLAKRHTGSTH